MKALDGQERLAAAVAAIRRGDEAKARELIYAVLNEDPRSVTAWMWACEIATGRDERICCLERILSIDPAHDGAHRYLAQLRSEPATVVASPDPAIPHPSAEGMHLNGQDSRVRTIDLLLLPLRWVFQLPLNYWFFILLALTLIGGLIYFRVNTDFFGLVGSDFDDLTISDSYDQIAADDVHWRITFEGGATEFSGVVRHVSPIRISRLRILTHDVLVTSGEYADPDVVSTSVFAHHFSWRSSSTAHPGGRINLLHTVPVNEEVHSQLLAIRTWDEVIVTGREILVIKAYDRDGSFLGDWRDTGCNTLLVESVIVVGE